MGQNLTLLQVCPPLRDDRSLGTSSAESARSRGFEEQVLF
jgi:hypothetical protein